MKENMILTSVWLQTPLGQMITIASKDGLYLLEFEGRRNLDKEIEQLKVKTKATIVPGENQIISSIKNELDQYFAGILQEFKTPVVLLGSLFQNQIWGELQKIPFGQTRSYAGIALGIARPTAFRAVAMANSTNQLAIIIPCHRVINKNGAMGGYAAGLDRKKWLINHETSLVGC